MATINLGRVKGENGADGADGAPGKDATINGVNDLNLVAGENITLSQEGNNLTISARGGVGGSVGAILSTQVLSDGELIASLPVSVEVSDEVTADAALVADRTQDILINRTAVD